MPSSRSSSLSRSNIRSKASVDVLSAYCGTAWRICAFVNGRPVLSRQMTRLSWRRGTVLAVARRWAGTVELQVAVDGEPSSDGGSTQVRALAFPELVGEPEVGDEVLL